MARRRRRPRPHGPAHGRAVGRARRAPRTRRRPRGAHLHGRARRRRPSSRCRRARCLARHCQTAFRSSRAASAPEPRRAAGPCHEPRSKAWPARSDAEDGGRCTPCSPSSPAAPAPPSAIVVATSSGLLEPSTPSMLGERALATLDGSPGSERCRNRVSPVARTQAGRLLGERRARDSTATVEAG